MKKLFLFLAFFSAVSLQAFSQTTPLTQKADSLFKLDDRAATNRKVNVMTKALINSVNQVLNYGSIEVGSSTIEYEGVSARFGSVTYTGLSGTVPIISPADDSTARIDLLVINSDSTLQVLTGIPSPNPYAPKPEVASQLALYEIHFNFGGSGSGGSVTFASQAEVDAGTNTTKAVNSLTLQTKLIDFGDELLSGLFPSQAGNAGKFLQTNGSSLSWQTASGGGGGSGYVPITGSDSLNGNFRFSDASTIDTKNTGDTIRI